MPNLKKITMLSIVAAAMLFTGCGEKSKESATDAASKAVESTKEAASHAADAVKEAGESVSAATDKAVEATKEAASKAVVSAKESVATAATAVADTATNVAGAAAYAKCAGCHGADGKTLALGKSSVIAGQSKEELITKLNGYKAGTINVSGMGTLMKGQVASMDDAAIEAVSTYISTMK
jgi:cytochrome c553